MYKNQNRTKIKKQDYNSIKLVIITNHPQMDDSEDFNQYIYIYIYLRMCM